MRRKLARALFITCIGSLTLGGCAAKEHHDSAMVKPANVASASLSEDHKAADSTASAGANMPATGRSQADTSAREELDSDDEAEAPPPPMEPVQASPTTSKLEAKEYARTSGALGGIAAGRGAPVATNSPAKYRAKAPSGAPIRRLAADPAGNSESYKDYGKNPMVNTAEDNQSTFAVDVDTASYAIARRKIMNHEVPPQNSVRVEEFVNYFRYDYAGPTNGSPFAVHMDAAPSPFAKDKHILRVGLQGKNLSVSERKPAHLVFLVDVSGSMNSDDKLGLAKRALRLLVSNLKENDSVALVTYAGSTGIALQPTSAAHKSKIFEAIENLTSGGGTAMASGMDLAYQLAAKKLSKDTVSRVIILSDGDANIGNTGPQDILKTIKSKVKEGVTMSTIGLGMGNYKDTMMERLANEGNGNYYYIDSFSEAKKVFQEQLGGTLEVIAKDVKIQVEFDKEVVTRYRLVGYENRDIADRDFRNDKVDAGEIGAGHTVTAIYEIELAKKDIPIAIVRIRHKQPSSSKATEQQFAFNMNKLYSEFNEAPQDLRFASAVMASAELLRGSPYAEGWKVGTILRIAEASAAGKADRLEFIALMKAMRGIEDKLTIAHR